MPRVCQPFPLPEGQGVGDLIVSGRLQASVSVIPAKAGIQNPVAGKYPKDSVIPASLRHSRPVSVIPAKAGIQEAQSRGPVSCAGKLVALGIVDSRFPRE